LLHGILHINNLLLHESEGELREEDLLMAFEKTTRDPLVDDDTNHLDQTRNTHISFFRLFRLLNSLEEEVLEGLEGVLVHVVNNPELNQQEVEHGSLGSYWTIGFS